jgi:hypothetical protein
LYLFLRFFTFEGKKFSRRSKEWEADFGEVRDRGYCPRDRHVSVETRMLFSSPAQHGHVRQIEGVDALCQEPHTTQERLKQSDSERRPNNA